MMRDITELAPVAAAKRIRYGNEPSQFFDVFLPTTKRLQGAAMMIHGGFWRAKYDLLHTSHLCAALADAGIAVVNLEYRRIGETGGGWPGSYEDVLAGFDRVAREFSTSLVMLGHSAGGHLALRMAVDRNPAGVVALAPVADLEMAYRLNLSNGAAAEFVGGTPQSDPEQFQSADPMRHSSDARRTLLHGTNDDVVPISLSESFVQARGADPGVVRVARIEGADHFDLIDPQSDAWEIVVSNVRGLLG